MRSVRLCMQAWMRGIVRLAKWGALGFGLLFMGRFVSESLPKRMPPLHPKSAQGRLTEEFNRRLDGNRKGIHVLALDQEETCKDPVKMAGRMRRFFAERGLFPCCQEDMGELCSGRMFDNNRDDCGAYCVNEVYNNLMSACFGAQQKTRVAFVFSLVRVADVGLDIDTFCNNLVGLQKVDPDLPVTLEMWEKFVLYHEAFGHGLDESLYKSMDKEGILVPGGLIETRGDIAAVLHIVQDTHALAMARFWAGARTLHALGDASLAMNVGKDGHLARINIYNNGDLLDRVLDRLERRLDDPEQAAAFFRMTDDELDGLVDGEMERESFGRKDFFARMGELKDAARIHGREVWIKSGQGFVEGAADKRKRAIALLRKADAARQYGYVATDGSGRRSPIRPRHPVPALAR